MGIFRRALLGSNPSFPNESGPAIKAWLCIRKHPKLMETPQSKAPNFFLFASLVEMEQKSPTSYCPGGNNLNHRPLN